jgi:UrcA family protein
MDKSWHLLQSPLAASTMRRVGLAGPSINPLFQEFMPMKTITLITTSILLSYSILSAAKAAPPSDVPSAIVKFRDLDTTRPAGEEELYRRLIRAARAVCGPVDPNGAVVKALVTPEYEACIDQALSGAVARFNRPEFTDYVAARTPKAALAGVQLATR